MCKSIYFTGVLSTKGCTEYTGTRLNLTLRDDRLQLNRIQANRKLVVGEHLMQKTYTFIPISPGWVATCDEGKERWPNYKVLGWEVSPLDGGGNRYTPVIWRKGPWSIDSIKEIESYSINVDTTVFPEHSGCIY